MITVAEALERLFALVTVGPVEHVPLVDAAGRVLAAPVIARRDQPPFPASAMDGYAVASASRTSTAPLRLIGEAAAGRAFPGRAGPGETVRIFTGAPLPDGTDTVVIQEDARDISDGILISEWPEQGANIRPAGGDFRAGDRIEPDRILRPADLALAASMNAAALPVRARPRLALIATGDELVMPGEDPGADQIVASNAFGLKALFEMAGAEVRLLPIARDTEASLRTAFALAEGSDLIVTIGGASVGDHDLVAPVADALGMQRQFYKVAMRPGKPLMAGRLAGSTMVGLPGNPVSAMVCGHIFILPMLRAMLGLGQTPAPRRQARLAAPLEPNGPREHYMRAVRSEAGVKAFDRQDSSLLSILGQSDTLIVRPPHDPARAVGDFVETIEM